TRYFMTIPEAATLVAQAAALSSQPGAAPVYVLDMGEPVRIYDLALRLVAMHGYTPRVRMTESTMECGTVFEAVHGGRRTTAGEGHEQPMDIVISGVRPGEKLFEQLAYDAEQLKATSHPGINCWAGVGADAAPDVTRLVADMSAVRHGGDR